MIFDLDAAHQGDWFTFFNSFINEKGEVVYEDPKPDAGRVCIRSLTPYFEQMQAKRKRKFEFALNPATRSMERVGYYDEPTPEQAKKERDDVWDYAITGIENFFDAKGEPILCTQENKIRLMAVPVFDRFVARCLQTLSGAGVKAEEELRKNA